MAIQPIPIRPVGGIDRSRNPMQNDLGTFWTLKGFKQSPTEPGRLVQVPYFYAATTLTQGTYYNAGSQTEPAASAVVAITTLVTITNYVARIRATGAQAQCFYQSRTVTSPEAQTGECFVVINSISGLAVTLGSTLDIEIDGAGTFKWQKNGAGYTLGVAITTAGVSIDGGNATVYFTTATGHTLGDDWHWTRTDCVHENGTRNASDPLVHGQHRALTYFVNASGRIMTIATDSSSVPYIISTGYRPIYGRGLATFYDHLIITNFSTSASLSAIAASTNIGTSDLRDLNAFVATDVNEAELITNANESVNQPSDFQMIGCFVYSGQLFVITSAKTYVTDYLGLPTLYSFREYTPFSPKLGVDYATKYNGYSFVAVGDRGTYILGFEQIYLFNGSFVDISPRLRGMGTNGYASIHYIASLNELHVRSRNVVTVLVYQESLDTWYERYCNFGTNTGTTCIQDSGITGPYYGAVSLRMLLEDTAFITTPVADASSGTTFGTPTIITQLLRGVSLLSKKEITGTYIAAIFTEEGSAYSTTTNCVLNLKWFTSDVGIITGSPTSNSNSTMTSTVVDRFLSYPRTDFRSLALQIDLTGLVSGKPPASVAITEIVPVVDKWSTYRPDR